MPSIVIHIQPAPSSRLNVGGGGILVRVVEWGWGVGQGVGGGVKPASIHTHTHYRSEQEEEEGFVWRRSRSAMLLYGLVFFKKEGVRGGDRVYGGSSSVEEVLYGFLLCLVQRRYTLRPQSSRSMYLTDDVCQPFAACVLALD